MFVYIRLDADSSLEPLMTDIASYVASLQAGSKGEGAVPESDFGAEGSQSKKRKLDDLKNGKTKSPGESTHTNLNGLWKSPIQFSDISFTIPQRKKMTLEIGTSKTEGVRAVNGATKELEGGVSYSKIGQ